MAPLGEVDFASLDPHRFDDLLSPEERDLLDTAVAGGARRICGRRVWHVNSTARGGGVAEMLQTLLPYARGAGLDVRWLTIGGDDDFFRVTKRIHNNLHGGAGDGGDLGDEERRVYEAVLGRDAIELSIRVEPDDVVVLEDPQTAGLIPALRMRGVTAVWRCHVGVDAPNDLVHRARRFLHPYVDGANALVFSRRSYAWEGLDDGRLHVIPPCIDPFSTKNAPMSKGMAAAVLAAAGLVDGGQGGPASACVAHPARVLEAARPHTATPLVLQVSRWDRLKDPLGVLEGSSGTSPPTRTRTSCSRGRPWTASPTILRGSRSSPRSASAGSGLPHRGASAFTSHRCRCATRTRTPGSSTHCRPAPTWWCRRASPRASG